MRWIGGALAVAFTTAAFAVEFQGTSARAISAEALEMIRYSPEDIEGNVRILAAALDRISDKRYQRVVAYRLRALQKKGGIISGKREKAAQALKNAQELLRSRPEDYLGNVDKLERYAEIAADTKYEARIKALLEGQKKKAEEAGGTRDRKYERMDIEDDVRAHPDKPYHNMRELERFIRQNSDLPGIGSTESLLERERASWEIQKADFERRIKDAKSVIELRPDDHEANIRMLEELRKQVVGTPLEAKVKALLSSVKAAGGLAIELDTPELSDEERLLRLVAEVMSKGASAPEITLPARLAEDRAHAAAEELRRTEELEKTVREPSTARELREAARKAAALPGGRKRAVELYERAGVSKDPTQASLAWRGLADFLGGLPLEGYDAEVAARKGEPDSWRYALACYRKAKKLAPEMAREEALVLAEGKLFIGLAEHFRERGRKRDAGNYEGRARRALKQLAKSSNEKNRNAALKLLRSIEGSR